MNKENFIKEIMNQVKILDKCYENPFIIALNGYSGSGKSHVAKVLSKELEIYIVGGDSVRQKIYVNDQLSHELKDVQELTDEICNLKIKKLLSAHNSIVLDRSVSSIQQLNKLENMYHVPVILIQLISDHEQNIERVIHRGENEKVRIDAYGDVDSFSGVHTREMYDEIREQKIYDIPAERFDYQIDARVSLEDELIQAEEVAKKIKVNIK